jgi:hypothetical protein
MRAQRPIVSAPGGDMKGTTLSGRLRRSLAVGTIAAACCSASAAAPVRAVEFYHRAFEHYFLSSASNEIAVLDSGAIAGWWRTSQRFYVDDAAGPGLVPVCRFFTAKFAAKASHFFTANAAECDALRLGGDWTYEGIAFYARPTEANGQCAAGTLPLLRLYNNGRKGAPNHAFTVDATKRDTLVAAGFVPEGTAFCVPVSADDAAARTMQLAGSSWEMPWAQPPYLPGFTSTFDTALWKDNGRLDEVDVRSLPAAIRHTTPGIWYGHAGFDPIAGGYVMVGSSGFTSGWGEGYLFDAVSGPKQSVCNSWIDWNLDTDFFGVRAHPFQPYLWSGCVTTEMIRK